MPFDFSLFGRRLTRHSGIVELMDDLGRALAGQPGVRMLGGGNPAAVPQVQRLWRERMQALLDDGAAFDRMLLNYDPPQGNLRFCAAVADLLSREFGWSVAPENVAVANGGQTALFYLFNLLAGRFAGNRRRKVLLPLAPEYVGYADQGLDDDLFLACRPRIDWPSGEASRFFKYQIDFDAVHEALKAHDVGAIAFSRPTNPTGNVLTDAEVQKLSHLAGEHEIPLIIDGAYGAPFPGIVFSDAGPFWAPHVVLTLSLSKLGLPSARTAIVVAPEQIATAISSMTAICGLANGTVGQQLVLPLIESGEILDIGSRILRPFYEDRSRLALGWTRELFTARGLDWAVHASEGAFFHWLWLRGLSIPTRELYERLKARNVLVVPGEHFFFGLSDDWPHRRECLRISFAQPEDVVREGLAIIADEAARARRG